MEVNGFLIFVGKTRFLPLILRDEGHGRALFLSLSLALSLRFSFYLIICTDLAAPVPDFMLVCWVFLGGLSTFPFRFFLWICKLISSLSKFLPFAKLMILICVAFSIAATYFNLTVKLRESHSVCRE